MRGSHSCFLGIDLGATHILGILTDLNAAVLDRIDFEIRPGLPAELILSQIKSIARGLLASGKAAAPVKSVGIGVPGFVNREKGISLVAENIPGWRDVRLREILESELGRPVEVDDCSRAFGRAERWLGAGKKEPNFLLLDLGYGIGLAVFIHGEPYAGSGNKSGEIGHTVVRLDGPPCTLRKAGLPGDAGLRQGQWPAQASAAIREGRSAVLAGLTHGNAEAVTAQDVSVAASMGDAYASGLLREAGGLIGVALANAVNLLNPSLVVIGGGLAGAGEPAPGRHPGVAGPIHHDGHRRRPAPGALPAGPGGLGAGRARCWPWSTCSAHERAAEPGRLAGAAPRRAGSPRLRRGRGADGRGQGRGRRGGAARSPGDLALPYRLLTNDANHSVEEKAAMLARAGSREASCS